MSYLHYGEPSYWEERYQYELSKNHQFVNFDWYCRFEDIWSLIENSVDPTISHKILVIGCGRSSIIDFLYKKG